MNSIKVAAALRQLAEAFETPDATPPTQPATAPRGRGRPAKGEGQATAAPAQPAVEADPFATTTEPAAPTASIEDVRKALTALKDASSQAKALSVLKKAGDADNITELSPDKYGMVVAAVNVELRILDAAKSPPPVDDDPFALPAAAPEKPLTLEDVKAVIVDAQKRTSTDAVQKVVMQFGGKGKNPDTGAEGPSLKALPPEKFAETIKALKALPATK